MTFEQLESLSGILLLIIGFGLGFPAGWFWCGTLRITEEQNIENNKIQEDSRVSNLAEQKE